MTTYRQIFGSWRLKDGDYLHVLSSLRDILAELVPGFDPALELIEKTNDAKPYEYTRDTFAYGSGGTGIRVVHTNEYVEAGALTLSADIFEFTPYGLSSGLKIGLKITRAPNHGWHQCLAEVDAQGPDPFLERLRRWAQVFFAAASLTGDEISASLRTAKFFIMRGSFKTALESIKPALDQAPENPEVLRLAGICYAAQDDIAAAEGYLVKSLEMDANNVDTLYNLGLCCSSKKSYERALELFLRAVELDPDNHPCWYQVGVMYEVSKKYDKAIRAYKRSIELSPNPGGAFGYVGLDFTAQAETALKRLNFK